MLHLPNGCRCSQPSVFPKDWKTAKSITCDWRIQYYFYDPARKKPTTPIVVKRMNEFKTIAVRREITKAILKELLHMLQVEGLNPYTGQKYITKDPVGSNTIGFIEALRYTFEKIKIAKDTRTDMKSMLKYFEIAAVSLGISAMPVSEIRRRHIKAVLEEAQRSRNLSPQRYNKYRDYLSMLCSEMAEDELLESNYIREIKKQDAVLKIRQQLTLEECKVVDQHLRKKVYSFWRFMHIFYQSGGRIVELLRVQSKDVNIDRQEYKVIINKGKKRKEVIRAINNEILPLWKELLQLSINPTDFIFSKGLVPGDRMIQRAQITRRWEVHVKGPVKNGGLGITPDFYSLKHLFLDRAAAEYDISTSQQLADHTTPVVTMRHYATGHKDRQLQKKKLVKISFAG